MSDAPPESPFRFLIVDDNPWFADHLAEIARIQGFEVEVTATAGDFKAAFLARTPSVLGVDLVMPDFDGLELLTWLSDVGSRVPTLVFSGKPSVYLRAAKVLAEAQGDFLVETFGKPVETTTLEAALQRVRIPMPGRALDRMARAAGGD